MKIGSKAVLQDLQLHHYIPLLKTVGCFINLTEHELFFLLDHSVCQSFKKNHVLFHHGKTAKYFHLMLEGWIKLYRTNKTGEEVVVTLVTKGDIFSEMATLKGSSYPYSAQVVSKEAKCLILEANTMREKITANAHLAYKLLSAMVQQTYQLSLTYEHLSRLTAAQRLGCFLLKLAMNHAYKNILRLPYSKSLIAARLGMKPETFSRTMKKLCGDLAISSDGRELVIPSMEKLKTYCQIECFHHESCDLPKRLICNNIQCDVYKIIKLT